MPVIIGIILTKLMTYSQNYASKSGSGLMEDDSEQLLEKAGSTKEIRTAAAKYTLNLERPKLIQLLVQKLF